MFHLGPTLPLLWLSGRSLNHHTRDRSSNPARDRKTESDMDPETLTSKDLLAVIAQHESSFQRHEAVLSHQEELMSKHSQLLSDVMGSIRQLFERLPGCFTPEWQQAYFSCRASITTSQALCWGS